MFSFSSSIDATDTDCLCKFVNDSPAGNCVMKKVYVRSKPFLCLFAIKDISKGEELRYNYEEDPANL